VFVPTPARPNLASAKAPPAVHTPEKGGGAPGTLNVALPELLLLIKETLPPGLVPVFLNCPGIL
jgi:hypothetical protein